MSVQIGNKIYNSRPLSYPVPPIVVTGSGIVTVQLSLPGRASYVMENITRASIAAGVDVTAARRFLINWLNSDNNLYYQAAGVGQTSNMVVDSTVFGTPSFPKPIGDGVLLTSTATLTFNVQDLSLVVPYTIYLTVDGKEVLNEI